MKNNTCEECQQKIVVFRRVRKKSSKAARAGKPICLPHHTLCMKCFKKLTDSTMHGVEAMAKTNTEKRMPDVIQKGKPVGFCELVAYCRSKGYPEPQDEVCFHPERKWRFDAAWPKLRIALEFEGMGGKGSGGFGRHQRIEGYTEDCHKYTEAVLMGWRVLRATNAMMRNGIVFGWIDRLFSNPADSPQEE